MQLLRARRHAGMQPSSACGILIVSSSYCTWVLKRDLRALERAKKESQFFVGWVEREIFSKRSIINEGKTDFALNWLISKQWNRMHFSILLIPAIYIIRKNLGDQCTFSCMRARVCAFVEYLRSLADGLNIFFSNSIGFFLYWSEGHIRSLSLSFFHLHGHILSVRFLGKRLRRWI